MGLLIEDQWWEYNQHLIPEPEPEPEPPLGSPGGQTPRRNGQRQPLSKRPRRASSRLRHRRHWPACAQGRHRRLKRIVAARIRQQQANTVAEEFDDFFWSLCLTAAFMTGPWWAGALR